VDLLHRCPRCNAQVVDRRSPVCTTCRRELPAEWVMSRDQAAKVTALDRTIKMQHAASMRSLDPLSNPDAPAFVQFLNSSSIPGSP
jgi:hypothetical protein